ncbi:MAG: transposase [candidate division Zixibacteria bacterium]|nr:transposase [candidate division Zixibacteria bacterium]
MIVCIGVGVQVAGGTIGVEIAASSHPDVERLHREVRRRVRVVSIFPNPASCLRLVSAVLNEISDEWLTGRTYLTFQGSD